MSKILLSLTLVASLGYCPNSIAQQPVPALPVYDVVVIKLDNSLLHGTSWTWTKTRFERKMYRSNFCS